MSPADQLRVDLGNKTMQASVSIIEECVKHGVPTKAKAKPKAKAMAKAKARAQANDEAKAKAMNAVKLNKKAGTLIKAKAKAMNAVKLNKKAGTSIKAGKEAKAKKPHLKSKQAVFKFAGSTAYLINLPQDTKRKALAKTVLAPLGLDLKVFAGVYGKDVIVSKGKKKKLVEKAPRGQGC